MHDKGELWSWGSSWAHIHEAVNLLCSAVDLDKLMGTYLVQLSGIVHENLKRVIVMQMKRVP